MPGALAGIQVLEFTEIIAGPFGGMLLAQMGAEVIKVEPPAGEPWRLIAQFIPTESRSFISLNHGKKGVTLDLTTPEGQEVVGKLLPDTDVVLVNYRPDVAKKLHIDYETLSKLNPTLIYCDNTAFGRKGPQAHRPGYDLIVQGLTGLMALEGKSYNGVPLMNALPAADISTGLMMAWSVSAALFHRERSGKGQKIETTLLGSALTIQTSGFQLIESADLEWKQKVLDRLVEARANGEDYDEQKKARLEIRPLRAVAMYYRAYKTKDHYVVIGCLSVALRQKLCDALGIVDKRIDDPMYDPTQPDALEYARGLVKKVEGLLVEKTTDEWLELFDEKGVPAGPFNFIEELMDNEQVLANDLQVTLEHSLAGTIHAAGPPFQMSETPLAVQRPSPALGEHNEEVLSSLGYSSDEIDALRESGVIC
ncbi:MAG: CoA transferase [Chloroflexi bacterium]|nr:CoA transferase [Chloroflexota bacterium]